MLDLDAPLIPGRNAAGYQIGLPLEEVPQQELARFPRTPLADLFGKPTGFRYEGSSVEVWVKPESCILFLWIFSFNHCLNLASLFEKASQVATTGFPHSHDF